MKKKIVFGSGGAIVALCGLAFTLVATAGVPEPVDTSKRGTQEYYTSDVLTQDLPEILTNLRGTGGKYIQIIATVEYRIGPELEPSEISGLFSARSAKLKDGFMMLLSEKTMSDVESREQKEILKEEVKSLIQKIVFPDKRGMVEAILFRDFKVQ